MQAVSGLNGQTKETDSSLELPEGRKPHIWRPRRNQDTHLEKQWIGCVPRMFKVLRLKRGERKRKEGKGRKAWREGPCMTHFNEWLPKLQNRKPDYFKPSCLWRFVTASVENEQASLGCIN